MSNFSNTDIPNIPKTEPNVPDWKIDGVETFTSTTNLTYNLQSEYDLVKLSATATTTTGSWQAELSVNGVTSGYDIIEITGASVNGANRVIIADFKPSNSTVSLLMSGRWNSKWRMGKPNPQGPPSFLAQNAENTTVNSPLTSITLNNATGDPIDEVIVEVLGRDIS